MKEAIKKALYFFFRICNKIKAPQFPDFLINWGYLIKSESLYNTSKVLAIDDRMDMHNLLSTKFIQPDEEIIFLEFGVFKGQTFAIWVANNKHPRSLFSGFDTFTGLPEDWGSEKKGSYSAQGKLPDINDSRASFCVGLIQDTLPGHVRELKTGTRKIIHIDVDLYNASLVTLIYLYPFLEKGDIVIFDDFFTFTKATHEFKAFCDFLALCKVSYKPLLKCRRGQYVIEIL